jgi:hypothetical protein
MSAENDNTIPIKASPPPESRMSEKDDAASIWASSP